MEYQTKQFRFQNIYKFLINHVTFINKNHKFQLCHKTQTFIKPYNKYIDSSFHPTQFLKPFNIFAFRNVLKYAMWRKCTMLYIYICVYPLYSSKFVLVLSFVYLRDMYCTLENIIHSISRQLHLPKLHAIRLR